MRERFLEYIKKHALIREDDRVLIGVSGGLDSVVLAHLFGRSAHDFALAHCNFQLRGEEADGDETFVADLAKTANVGFFNKRFDTTAFARENGLSTQMAARELRYTWFSEICEIHGFTKIATAHHLDDSIETFIYNVARGTSVSGLRGILPMRGAIIRPLLGFSRNELERYASDHLIIWREDSSNQSDKYRRNFIRHQITPKLEALNPEYRRNLQLTMEKNREVEALLYREIERQKTHLFQQKGSDIIISKHELLDGIPGPFILYKLLQPYGFNYAQSKELLEIMGGTPGKILSTGTHTLFIDRSEIIITEKKGKSANC